VLRYLLILLVINIHTMRNTVLLAGLTAGGTAQNLTAQELFWSYGRSPAVAPRKF